MSLGEKLAKVKSPNLQSQQHSSIVLGAIEDTLREQKTEFTPTAYLAALLALLNQSVAVNPALINNEVLTSTVYLLDLVIPHAPPALLRSQFTKILAALSPVIFEQEAGAPLIRSTIGCLESILIAQDSTAWSLPQSQIGPRQALTALLALAVDGRPKIRKRAQESVTAILKTPPAGPSLDHPAADLCAAAALGNLKNAVDVVNETRKRKARPDASHDPAIIHALQLTKTIAIASGGWPSRKIEPLCELLLFVSRSRNDYLVMSALDVFEVIFDSMRDEVSSFKLLRLLEAIIELKPAQNDSQLLPTWIAILSSGYGVAGEIEPEDTFAKLPELFDLISEYLTSSSHNIRVSVSECLISFFSSCIPGTVILTPSLYDEKLFQRIANKANSLLSVKFQSAWMEVFTALSALFDSLRWRGDPYLLPIVQTIGELRGTDGFHGKKEADAVLGHAIRNLGPQAVLSVLPLNLTKPRAGQQGRAWLLPLLRDHVSNTHLSHFKSELVPLSEAMYERILNHGSAEKTMEIKIYETVVQQVWATLPGYCDLPLDLQQAVDQSFAELLSNLLYKQTDLRVDLCRGLQNLVESNQALIAGDLADEVLSIERRVTKDKGEKNIAHLATLSSNLLVVLFNVYSQTLPQSRAYILQCINAYLSITPEKDLIETFERVSKMLESALPSTNSIPPAKQTRPKGQLPPTSHTLLDLIITLSVHLPRNSLVSLFSLASSILTNPVIISSDPQLIKKAYKLIPRLATSSTGAEALTARNEDLRLLILSTSDQTPIPARRDRLLAITTLVSLLPLKSLHFIPSIISEVVLACKETNEKARSAGFDLLIAMAEKISNPSNPTGTIICNSKVPHMPDNAPDAPATIEEMFTMVSAGLAGVAPHMVAASIIALSRLLFEFHDILDIIMLDQLLETVCMFLQSNNREIVRSVLGFVKVMVVVLPAPSLSGRMEVLVKGMMVWSKENKGRMRAKVKGILERCMRKFGAADVENWVGELDRKMVVNIRKRKERAKRKGKAEIEDNEEGDDKEGDRKFDNEFDEAVYGSDDESEIVGSDEDGADAMSTAVSVKDSRAGKKGLKSRREQFIRQDDDDDEPLDLLDPKSMSSISSKKRVSFQDTMTAGKRKMKAKTNEDGKLVFDTDNDENDVLMTDNSGNIDGNGGRAVDAYIDAVDGPDAVRRGQRGRLKIRSGNQKKNKREQGFDQMDLDADEAREVARGILNGSGSRSPKAQQQTKRKGLGMEKSRHGGYGGGNRGAKRNGRAGKKVSFGGGIRRR